MIGILNAITDFFATVWAIFELILNLLFTLFWLVFKAIEIMVQVAAAFPFLTAGIVAIVIVCVVYKIMGREASS